MKNQIAIKHRRSIVLPLVGNLSSNNVSFNNHATSLIASMMQLGFMPSEALGCSLAASTVDQIAVVYKDIIPILQKMKGADVKYTPMYPNFPQQVMEASDMELFINAILHYWTLGTWMPEYETLPRGIEFESSKFIEIGVISDEEFDKIFEDLIGSNDSISAGDKKHVEWFIKNDRGLDTTKEIKYKENLCLVASLMLDKGKDVTNLLKTATDVLRVATHLSGGDISLAEKTKFKSFSRKIRRMFANALAQVATEEDINRHRGKWVRLFHSLHIGEYSPELFALAKKIRNNEKIETFNARVEAAVGEGDVPASVQLLKQRPGEFARRLDQLIRMDEKSAPLVVAEFMAVADKVNSRLLFQVAGHMKTRHEDVDKRVVFPKGNTQRATVVRSKLAALSESATSQLLTGIHNVLLARFTKLDDLGKVWIDPELRFCPLPTQQRSASEGLKQVARGTRLPFGDDTKNTLRFFIYWVGQDIDLSATLHDENFKMMEQISYTRLRSTSYDSCHSGDITSAPNGASEFIDITVDKAVAHGARYVAMNVYVYSGPTFAEHEKVYAGWMTRDKPKSNEIYDPKTVEQKIDLTANSKNAIPVIFDLVERKAIWADLNNSSLSHYGGNNLHSNRASIQETTEAMVRLDNKISLYELFMLHAQARGELVESKDDADVIFSFDGGVTPYDISIINADYLV